MSVAPASARCNTTGLATAEAEGPVTAAGADPTLALSVVVPVYNSAATVAPLLERLARALDALTPHWEVILVDDGSRDGSWAAIESARPALAGRLVAVQLMRNYGQHNALMCGLRLARGAHVATIDDDLQNPPEAIGALLAHARAHGLDLVYGHPEERAHAGWRNAGAGLVQRFFRTVFGSAHAPTSFRVLSHRLVRAVMFHDLSFTYLDGLFAWCTTRIGSVAVPHHARAEGRSGYTLGKLVTLALNLYTNFSLLPLQLVSALGFLSAFGGFALGAWFLVRSLAAQISVPGYASTIVAVLVLGGVQLLALGVIGEYIGRMHLNVNRKPQYVVREVRR